MNAKADLSNYKAVILAGGKGTRLYPVTREIPKPLLPIHKKPIINYLVDLFISYGVKDVAVLISNDFKDDFEWWAKRYYPSLISGQNSKITLVEETEPLGTFGGLWFLKKWIGGDSFFMTNGDELKDINLMKMAKFHQTANPVATLALVKVPNPQDYGVVICKSGIVKEFIEKPENPSSKYINSGLYLFSPKIFNYHPGPRFLMTEKDVFPNLAKEKKLAGFKFNGKWMDCGTWERYENALKDWETA